MTAPALQRLAFPLICGQLAFAVNGFVTQFFLARSSMTALHASLPGSMLAIAFSSLFISTLGYSGTLLAQRHGAGDSSGARAVFRCALLLAALSVPLFFLAVPVGHRILATFNTTPEVLAAESSYFDILLANGFFTALAAVLGGFFTGRGKTRLVGGVTVFGFFVNMALSALLIPSFGIAGAGWSATLAHVVPCLILGGVILAQINWESDFSNRGQEKKVSAARELLRLGLPNGVRSVIDIGGFFVFVALLAECAPAAAAASTAAFAINGLYQAFPQGLAAALEIATARGEARTLRAALVLTAGYVLVFALLLAFFGGVFFQAFGPSQPDLLPAFTRTALVLTVILAIKALFESLVIVLQAHLRGCGETALTFRVQFIASLCFWVPLFFAVRRLHPSIPAYWLTMIACSALSTLLLSLRAARSSRRWLRRVTSFKPAGAPIERDGEI